MQTGYVGWLLLTLPLAVSIGCSSEYDLGSGLAKSDAATAVAVDAGVVAPSDAARPIANRALPFPCDEWGAGKQLGSPGAAVSSALGTIWSGQNAEDGLQKYSAQVSTAGDLECVIRDALEDARARPFVALFYSKWLKLDKVPSVQSRAPEDVMPSDRFQILANDVINFATDVSVAGQANFARLLTSPRPLASAGAPLSAAREASLAAGILSDQAVAYANTVFAASFYRGFWFVRTFMCMNVPPEPNFGQPPLSRIDGVGSFRQRYTASMGQSLACQGCHKLFDPPGFALDPFDELGRIRQSDVFGFPFDTTGKLGTEKGDIPFTDLHSLGQVASESDEASACLAARWQLYAAGADPSQSVEISEDAVAAAAKLRRNNGSITAVIADAVTRQITAP